MPIAREVPDSRSGLQGQHRSSGPYQQHQGDQQNLKKRHYGHDHDIKEEKKDETGTTLSRHIHKLREAGTDFDITWDLLEKRIAGYNPISKQCRLKCSCLCLTSGNMKAVLAIDNVESCLSFYC